MKAQYETLVTWAEDAAVTNLLPDLSCLKKVCKASLLIKEATVVKAKAQHHLHHQIPPDTQQAVDLSQKPALADTLMFINILMFFFFTF